MVASSALSTNRCSRLLTHRDHNASYWPVGVRHHDIVAGHSARTLERERGRHERRQEGLELKTLVKFGLQ